MYMRCLSAKETMQLLNRTTLRKRVSVMTHYLMMTVLYPPMSIILDQRINYTVSLKNVVWIGV